MTQTSGQGDRVQRISYGEIAVSYRPRLNVGGEKFGQDFIPVIKSLFGKVQSLCEFASGPGLIGFSALANGLCEHLCLIDINPEAIQCCRQTVIENQLGESVSTYVSNVFRDIPQNEKWDLVICNPPFDRSAWLYGKDWRFVDSDWSMRRELYAEVHRYLSPGASVVLSETINTSSPKLWHRMIDASEGLEFVKCFRLRTARPDKGPTLYHTYGAMVESVAEFRRAYPNHFSEFSRRVPFFFWPFSVFYPYYFVWSRNKATAQR